MEDKRIKKTKKNLKSTLIAMLNQMSFEQITITELCRQSDTSRITFYKHYNDKYALADEIFQDYLKAGIEIYEQRQQQNNHRNDIVTGYCNMLDSIFEVYYGNYDFFRHTNPEENPHLAFSFYKLVLDTVEMHTDRIRRNLKLRYTPKQIAGFLCYGILGFINESHKEKVPRDEILRGAREILVRVLRSESVIR